MEATSRNNKSQSSSSIKPSLIKLSEEMKSRAAKRKATIEKQSTTSNKRATISFGDKLDIIEFKKQNPFCTLEDIKANLSVSASVSAISKILKQKENIKTATEGMRKDDLQKRSKNSQGYYPQLDQALVEWFVRIRARGVPVSNELLEQKALIFKEELVSQLRQRNETEEANRLDKFKASGGFIDGWKKRHHFTRFRVCGESGSVDKEQLSIEREKIGEILDEFAFCDVFNLDEAALFFNLLPCYTLGVRGEKGTKKSKARLTAVFITNADGSEKLKPIVIGNWCYWLCILF